MQNFNLASLMGSEDITDMDYVEDMGLDPALAGTPQINDAILDQVMQNNIDYFISSEGMDEAQAKSRAQRNRDDTKRQIDQMLASKGML